MTDISTSKFAALIEREVIGRHGAPKSIMSDRGSLFTSEWWSTFCYELVIKRKFSTAFHPQIDGVTERQNQILECYLRCYVNYQQDDWARLLFVAEFAYNTSVYSATGKTLIKMTRRYTPAVCKKPAEVPPLERGENKAVKQEANLLQEGEKEAKDIWRHASEAAAKYYDKKHQQRIYIVGDSVMLSSRHIRLRRVSKKLSDKCLRPFLITKKLGQNAYQLSLPKMYGRIHPTFYVSLLEPYRMRDNYKPPALIEIDNEEEWEVDRVLDVDGTQPKRKFLVRWKDCTAEEDSWQPEEDLEHAQEAVQEYYKGRENAPRSERRKRNAKKSQ
jgi:Chromo (CHRromatin Organisation MOdifier) domain